MKKIVSLMFILLSPFYARAMNAQPTAAPEAETPLSPRTECLINCSTPLIEMVRHTMSQLPDEKQITEINELIEVANKAHALRTLEQSLVPNATRDNIEISKWREAQRLLCDHTKETFLKQIIQEIRESNL